jgi:hypothetical protein
MNTRVRSSEEIWEINLRTIASRLQSVRNVASRSVWMEGTTVHRTWSHRMQFDKNRGGPAHRWCIDTGFVAERSWPLARGSLCECKTKSRNVVGYQIYPACGHVGSGPTKSNSVFVSVVRLLPDVTEALRMTSGLNKEMCGVCVCVSSEQQGGAVRIFTRM